MYVIFFNLLNSLLCKLFIQSTFFSLHLIFSVVTKSISGESLSQYSANIPPLSIIKLSLLRLFLDKNLQYSLKYV